MRHYRRSEDADTHIEHVLVPQNLRAGHETEQYTRQTRLGKEQFRCEACADDSDQRDNQSLHVSKALVLKI
jgi:hypothetical protein